MWGMWGWGEDYIHEGGGGECAHFRSGGVDVVIVDVDVGCVKGKDGDNKYKLHDNI